MFCSYTSLWIVAQSKNYNDSIQPVILFSQYTCTHINCVKNTHTSSASLIERYMYLYLRRTNTHASFNVFAHLLQFMCVYVHVKITALNVEANSTMFYNKTFQKNQTSCMYCYTCVWERRNSHIRCTYVGIYFKIH